ncbi:MAG: hypothetical protein OEX08_02605, partial [Candidatus Nomurabacteria bacterium]|nr:hypothetical protein [Candidatus Nomurabacteria bacterium]
MNFRRKESHQKSNISSDTENTFLEERCKSCTPFIIVTSLVSFVVVVVGFIVYAQFFNPAGLFRAKAQIQGISTTAENTKEYIATLPPVSFAKSQKQNRGVLMFRGNPSRSSYGIDLFFIK